MRRPLLVFPHKQTAQRPSAFLEVPSISVHPRRAGWGDVRIHARFAALEPQPPELQQLFRTVHGNQAAMDGFGEYRSDFCRCSQKGTPVLLLLLRVSSQSNSEAVLNQEAAAIVR